MCVHVFCKATEHTNNYVHADLKDILKSEDESNYSNGVIRTAFNERI